MAEKSDVLKPEEEHRPAADAHADSQRVRAALQRLRRIGEDLPTVDAAALVREGREAAGRDDR